MFPDVQSLMVLYQVSNVYKKNDNVPVGDVVLVHKLDALVN